MNLNNVTYVVNQEKRTVTAILTDCDLDLYKKILNHAYYGSYASLAVNPLVSPTMLPEKIVAVARCHPDDIFDVEVGKRVARAKLRESYRRQKNKRIDKLLADMEILRTRMLTLYDKEVSE